MEYAVLKFLTFVFRLCVPSRSKHSLFVDRACVEMKKMEILWNYYKTRAINSQKIMKNGKELQSSYSIAWFFKPYEHANLKKALNPLTRAFLGDETAYRTIRRAKDDQLKECRKEITALFEGSAQQPNAAQIDAIANAAANQISIIQGPPGTGKTETIKDLLLYLMWMEPTPAVAVVSSNKAAIDNIVSKVKCDSSLCSKYADLGNKNKRMTFLEDGGKGIATHKTLNAQGKEVDTFELSPALLKKFPIIFSTLNSLNKCIWKNGRYGYHQFDYVIVDECSQVSSMLGLLAISAAKHLVLFGDSEQLPPVHYQEAEEQEIVDEGIEPYYLDEDNNSFMKACAERFGKKAGQVMLDEHYRCHPAIIEFCNRIAYDGKLVTMKEDDGQLPIRVRWYEGDYWERVPWGKKRGEEPPKQKKDEKPARNPKREKNFNEKQIQVFLEDECPYILKKFREDKHFGGFRVLSPYVAQLDRLDAEIKASGALKDLPGYGVTKKEGKKNTAEYTYTIHKAQGREYSLVYIMPVQDTGKAPWGQKKELVNVTVSRAKDELCVITSAYWMPPELQKDLLGYVANTDCTNEPDHYIAELLKYVYEEQKTRTVGENFGFQRASAHSVFDRSLYWRRFGREEKAAWDRKADKECPPSAPELCMMEALMPLERGGAYQIYRELPLKEVEGIRSDDPEVQAYIDNNARFDFVICKDGRVHAIIEVDGAYHRKADLSKDENAALLSENLNQVRKNDQYKNEAVRALGSAFYEKQFIRLPTDGTTHDEIEEYVKMALLSAGSKQETLPAVHTERREINGDQMPYEEVKKAAKKYLNALLTICRNRLKKELEKENGYAECIEEVAFNDGNLPDYENKGQAAFYFLKFANFNILEYMLMYQLALRMLKEEKAAIAYSFGCGPGFDAFAGVYAWNELRRELPDFRVKKLEYNGVDLAKWPYQLLQYKVVPDFIGTHYSCKDMVSLVSEQREKGEIKGNILFFPKVLSELPMEVMDSFCENLKAVGLENDRIVLCVSYRNRGTVREDWTKAGKIVETLESMGYTADKQIPPEFLETEWATETFENTAAWDTDGYPCYSAKKEADEVLWKRYADLKISKNLFGYLLSGIRSACPKYKAYKEKYDAAHQEPAASVYESQICERMECPDYKNCRTAPRTKLYAEKGTGVSFQVLLFTRH